MNWCRGKSEAGRSAVGKYGVGKYGETAGYGTIPRVSEASEGQSRPPSQPRYRQASDWRTISAATLPRSDLWRKVRQGQPPALAALDQLDPPEVNPARPSDLMEDQCLLEVLLDGEGLVL